MIGDVGPYMDPNGPDVWVPRTVPYLQARTIAKEALDYSGDRIRYVGKSDATLFGFTRECRCEEACELANRCRRCRMAEWECSCPDPDLEDDDVCLVPSWHFRTEER